MVLADRVEDVPALRAAIRKADAELPGPDVIGNMVTVEDLLPGTADVQQKKLALLAEIRRAADDPAMELLEAEDKRAAGPPAPARARCGCCSPQDLPPLARRLFTEADGSIGPGAAGLPARAGAVALERPGPAADRLGAAAGDAARRPQVDTSGSAVIFASMIRSILRDGPLATLASLAAVILLVLLRVRPLRGGAGGDRRPAGRRRLDGGHRRLAGA